MTSMVSALECEDLAAYIPAWRTWLADRVKPSTAALYVVHLRTFMPEGMLYLRSAFTGPAVARWLSARTTLVQKRKPAKSESKRKNDPEAPPASASTKRRYFAAVQSFVQYLIEVGVLAESPVHDVSPPPAGESRCHFLELPDVKRLIDGAAPLYRAIFALAYGAGP